MGFSWQLSYVISADFRTATTVFSILGKAMVCIIFTVVYVHSSELFPTEVRNVGVGTASMCARVGSMVAPYLGRRLVRVPDIGLCLLWPLCWAHAIIKRRCC